MRFELKALKGRQGLEALELDARDADDAIRQATAQGYTVLSARRSFSLATLLPRSSSALSLALFSQELVALLEAGLNLVEALETLAEKEERAEAKKVIRGLLDELYEGRSFSHALNAFPHVFTPLYVATVLASERTGDLPEAMARFVAYQAQLDVVRKKLVAASVYPVLLILVGGGVTMFLLGYVVPRFSHIYEDMGSELPLLSQWLLTWGQLIESNGIAVLVVLVVLVAVAATLAREPAVRQWVADRIWRFPAIGQRWRVYQLARFYRTLGMLLRGGTPIIPALGMTSGLLTVSLRERLSGAAAVIKEGRSISDAMESHDLVTPVALRMLRVGERTGRMGEMMERIATFHDDEVARWVDLFTRLFEPLLMAAIGIVIGIIVVLMYLPIFELAGSIQ
ncbi:MAG: type II secretion system F family protein [Burkholderiales bacterium]|nr:type II secretion system F family protein [Burkholderiales bacterium]